MATKISRLFIDSSFFVALYNPLDNQHQKAIKIAKGLEGNKELEPIISNFIFSETVTILSQKVSRRNAVAAGTKLSSGNSLIYINQLLEQKTWEIFQKIDRKNMSFVDCSILAIMQLEGINSLLTFDGKDFKSLQKVYSFKLYPL